MNKPIIFNGQMIKALHAGLKTQTRRLDKFNKDLLFADNKMGPARYNVGDMLWVRESVKVLEAAMGMREGLPYAWLVQYNADLKEEWCFSANRLSNIGSKPSIHMSRFMSRMTLRISEVRKEFLNDISPEDALSEGVMIIIDADEKDPCGAFKDLWGTIHTTDGEYGWHSNPIVWVIKFDVFHCNVDHMPEMINA